MPAILKFAWYKKTPGADSCATALDMSRKKTSGFTSRLKKRLSQPFEVHPFRRGYVPRSVFAAPASAGVLVILLAVYGHLPYRRYDTAYPLYSSKDICHNGRRFPALRRQTALLLSEVDVLEKKLNDNEVCIRRVAPGHIRRNPGGKGQENSVYVDSMSKKPPPAP